MQKYWNTVQDEKGNPREGASVAVQQNSSNSTIYADQAGLNQKTNPLTTDSRGYFEFYAAAGEYDLVVSGSKFDTYTITDGALIGLPSDDVTFIASGTGAFSEDLQSRGRWWQLITDYMSVADRASLRAGTTVNIDTAITDAHGGLPTNGGDILFPPGSYKLTSTPSFTKRVRMLGMGGTAVTAAGTGSTVIIKAAAMTTTLISFTVDGSGIENLEFEGENGNTGDGITLAAGRCFLRDVAVYSMGNDGVRIGTDAGVNANLWYLENIKTKNNGRDGVRISDKTAPTAPDCNGGTLVHLDTQSNTGAGLYLGNTAGSTFIGVTPQTNGANGITVSADADTNQFYGGDLAENNTGKSVSVTAGATQNAFYVPNMLNTQITDNGTLTRYEVRESTGVGMISKGLFQQQFSRGGANYIQAVASSGSLVFTTNGDTAIGANGVVTLNSDGTFALGKGGASLAKILTGSASLDPASLLTLAATSTTVTVTGAQIGDQVIANHSKAVAGIILYGSVTSSDTVTVTIFNASSGTIDVTSGTLKVLVVRW